MVWKIGSNWPRDNFEAILVIQNIFWKIEILENFLEARIDGDFSTRTSTDIDLSPTHSWADFSKCSRILKMLKLCQQVKFDLFFQKFVIFRLKLDFSI